jgi:hypothetical protein
LNATVTSRLDFQNALLAGAHQATINPLQWLQRTMPPECWCIFRDMHTLGQHGRSFIGYQCKSAAISNCSRLHMVLFMMIYHSILAGHTLRTSEGATNLRCQTPVSQPGKRLLWRTQCNPQRHTDVEWLTWRTPYYGELNQTEPPKL